MYMPTRMMCLCVCYVNQRFDEKVETYDDFFFDYTKKSKTSLCLTLETFYFNDQQIFDVILNFL